MHLWEGTSLTAGCAALGSSPSSLALPSSSPVARDPMWVSHLGTVCQVTTPPTHSLSIFWKSSSRGSWKVAASERWWSSSARERSAHSSPSSPWPGEGVASTSRPAYPLPPGWASQAGTPPLPPRPAGSPTRPRSTRPCRGPTRPTGRSPVGRLERQVVRSSADTRVTHRTVRPYRGDPG